MISSLTGMDPTNPNNNTKFPEKVYALETAPVKFGGISLLGMDDTLFTLEDIIKGSKVTRYIPKLTTVADKNNYIPCPGCGLVVIIEPEGEDAIYITDLEGSGEYGPFNAGSYTYTIELNIFRHGSCEVSTNFACLQKTTCWFWMDMVITNNISGGGINYDVYANGTYLHTIDELEDTYEPVHNGEPACGLTKVFTTRFLPGNEELTITTICANCGYELI